MRGAWRNEREWMLHRGNGNGRVQRILQDLSGVLFADT